MMYQVKDGEELTVSNSVKKLTTSKITADGVIYARIQVKDQQLRATFEGTDPVSGGRGELWNPGDIVEVWGTEDMKALEMIRESGSSDAKVEVTYLGTG